MKICSADNCNSIPKYDITEMFQDPNNSNKLLFTQTHHWCEEYNNFDTIYQSTEKSVKEI